MKQGTSVNYDDYREYSYNYDGTGFEVKIDLEAVSKAGDFLGRNLVMLDFANRADSGRRILRGADGKWQKAIESAVYVCGDTEVRAVFDCRETLLIQVIRGEA